jgi:hypothetical protein
MFPRFRSSRIRYRSRLHFLTAARGPLFDAAHADRAFDGAPNPDCAPDAAALCHTLSAPARAQSDRRGLSQEQIENEILNGSDLSKKGSASRRLAYAARAALKAIALSAR